MSDVAPNGKAYRGDLDNILAKALKKRPDERYASVTAFADDLRRYLRREPVSARPDTLAYRTGKFLQRRAAVVATAATVMLLIAGLVGFYTVRLTAERDRARLEADKSAKMSALLTSLMFGADPYATRDREPTVRNILDAGAERVRQELADQPELKAEMLTVIGRVYQRLGLLDTAQPLLDEALSIERRAGTPDTVRTAQTINELGILVRERGDPTGAAPLLEEALAMRRRLLGNEDKDVAVTLVELGRAFVDAGQHDRAEPLFRESLDIRRRRSSARRIGKPRPASPTSASSCYTVATSPPRSRSCASRWRRAAPCSAKIIPTSARAGTTSGWCCSTRATTPAPSQCSAAPWLSAGSTSASGTTVVETSMGYVAMSLREQGTARRGGRAVGGGTRARTSRPRRQRPGGCEAARSTSRASTCCAATPLPPSSCCATR